MKKQNGFFKKVGVFFKENYWVAPLLLVAIVFIVVFSIGEITNLGKTIAGWFNKNSRPSKTEIVTEKKLENIIEGQISTGEKFYVYMYDSKTEDTYCLYNANKSLNKYIKYNDVKIYSVNVGVKKTDTVTGVPTKFVDTTMEGADLVKYATEISDFLKEAAPDKITTYTDANTYSELGTIPRNPLLIECVKTADGFNATNMLYDDDISSDNLGTFFAGKYVIK